MVTEDSLTDVMREQLLRKCPSLTHSVWLPVEYNPPYLVAHAKEGAYTGCYALFKQQQLIATTFMLAILLDDVVIIPEGKKLIWR